MKKLLFLLSFNLLVFILQAQEQTFTQMFDSVFMHINRADATTGILYNRVIPLSALHKYSKPDTANSEVFIQSYYELYRAAFDLNKRLPFTSDSLKNLLSNQENVVDVGIIHYKYNVLNDSIINQKIYLDQDNAIRENTSIVTSLYSEQTAFMVSPLKEQVNELSVTFNFKDLFLFDNTNNSIVQLFADFGNGNGLQMITLNTSVSVFYSFGGTYTLNFVAVLSNGDTLTTCSQIEIIDPLQTRSIDGQTSGWDWIDKYDKDDGPFRRLTAQIDVEVYESSSGYNNGNVWIYYANGKENGEYKLKKPILIVDGFDPENPRRFEDHEKEDKPNAEKLRYYSIWRQFQYEKNGEPVNFGRELLENYGYDLVVLDLPKGGGYIERNGMVCIEVINFINQKLKESGSPHEIIVVGPSMGGQITRYALAYMENHKNANTNYGNHNCRLWVSYDSPHQGANINVGAQALIDYFASDVGDGEISKTWNNVICSVAAKQMLIHHKANGAKTYFQKWEESRKNSYPATNGYPINLRKIAVANGSLNTRPMGFSIN